MQCTDYYVWVGEMGEADVIVVGDEWILYDQEASTYLETSLCYH